MWNLPTLVRKQFKAAQESGDLTFYATRVVILHCGAIPFQIRFSPALANKPKSARSSKTKPVDPFEHPAKGLFIADLPPSHFLVLNKFPIIPDHFILATKEFKEQTDILEENDLGAAYECLKAYRTNGEELFGFFNSGEHSGASQPHRHIQFLPVSSMLSGIEEEMKWDLLANSLANNPQPEVPFQYFASKLPENPSPSDLHQIYTTLHGRACRSIQSNSQSSTEAPTAGEKSPISYNMALTDHTMILCPRTSEGLKVKAPNGDLIGPVALNGTLLAGTLLVKTESEWEALHNDESNLADVLHAIGVPSTKSGQHL